MFPDIPYSVWWLVIAIILGVIEAVTFGIFTIWFAIGAIFAMIAAALGLGLYIQIIVFLVSSGVLLYFTRPILRNYFKVRTERTNADRLIGEKGVVIEKIDTLNGTGQVKVNGQVWSARSADNHDIQVNEKVEVLNITGVKLIVIKHEEL